MRKYNRRILTALVVAYKKGIINRKPLNRWLSFKQIFNQSLKYFIYLSLFTFLFLMLDNQIFSDMNLQENIYIGGLFIQKSRIISGIIMGFLALNLYQLGKYYIQVYIVKRLMKNYKTTDNDVEILNKVTFKINV